jgi:hypothetical protein
MWRSLIGYRDLAVRLSIGDRDPAIARSGPDSPIARSRQRVAMTR